MSKYALIIDKGDNMKYVPNILSFMRLIAVIPLLLLTPLELPFMIIYVIAGLTDMIDGPIARKFDITSQFGAALDGFAIFCFYLQCCLELGH